MGAASQLNEIPTFYPLSSIYPCLQYIYCRKKALMRLNRGGTSLLLFHMTQFNKCNDNSYFWMSFNIYCNVYTSFYGI